MKEIWKEIEGYEGIYWISNTGKVRNRFGERKLAIRPNGYVQVGLSKDGKNRTICVHRLVAEAFVQNPCPEKYNIVNHLDEDKANNNSSNLEWTDSTGNNNYGSHIKKVMDSKPAFHRYSAVLQIIPQPDGTFITIRYENLNEAAEITKLSKDRIREACNRRQYSYADNYWVYVS